MSDLNMRKKKILATKNSNYKDLTLYLQLLLKKGLWMQHLANIRVYQAVFDS